VVQGIGARMNGLFYTTPIPEVQERLRRLGCTVPFEDGTISQVRAAEVAMGMGYRMPGVTLNSFLDESPRALKEAGERNGALPVSFMVCSTGVDERRARDLAAHADVVWSCASTEVREVVGPRACLQITATIPVFVLTGEGLRAVSGYSPRGELLLDLDHRRQYYLGGDRRGERIPLGRFSAYLSEARLPLRGRDEPGAGPYPFPCG
jgi:hypothetical protein